MRIPPYLPRLPAPCLCVSVPRVTGPLRPLTDKLTLAGTYAHYIQNTEWEATGRISTRAQSTTKSSLNQCAKCDHSKGKRGGVIYSLAVINYKWDFSVPINFTAASPDTQGTRAQHKHKLKLNTGGYLLCSHSHKYILYFRVHFAFLLLINNN